ncbi:MAG: YitT family protein [Desulfobacteraceae bacterium]|nr:MAG: YitT family protein [Desulfobacteraceae bacterium]
MTDTRFSYSVAWNLFLITTGSAIIAAALKGIAYSHAFIPGGLFGAASLIYFTTGRLDISAWFLLLNIPMFLIAWKFISKRFLFYSLYAMIIFTFIFTILRIDFKIQNQLYAAITCGMLSGIGAGIVLRSLGSNGGLDVMGVLFYQKFNIGLGKFYFAFNAVLYAFSFLFLDNDLVIASMIMLVCTSFAMEYALSMFSQRKTVLIISEKPGEIVRMITENLKMGSTFINGTGTHSGKPKQIILTVINNIQLKRLEEIVFTVDEHALLIAENTFSVIGSNLARRKIY